MELILNGGCLLLSGDQAIEHDKSLSVIINTAYSSYRDSYQTWAADAFLVKSSDVTELIRTARELTGFDYRLDANAEEETS